MSVPSVLPDPAIAVGQPVRDQSLPAPRVPAQAAGAQTLPLRYRPESRPARPRVPGPTSAPASAVALLGQARRALAEAEAATEPAERYATAHLAALRAAAAVLAVRAKPERRRTRPTSVWVLLTAAAPEFAEWASFFAAGSRIRAAVQAGVTRLVSTRDADDLVRQTGQFLELVAKHRMHQVPR